MENNVGGRGRFSEIGHLLHRPIDRLFVHFLTTTVLGRCRSGAKSTQQALLMSRLQWLHAVFAAELGQIVVDNRPLSAGVVIVVRLRITVDLAVQRGKRNIDDFRLSLTEHLAAADAAKTARALFRTLIGSDMLFALSDFETLWRDTGPGHEARTMWSAAHGAVTMAAERGR